MIDRYRINSILGRLRIPGFKRLVFTEEVCRCIGKRPRQVIRIFFGRGIQVLVIPNPLNASRVPLDPIPFENHQLLDMLEKVPIEAVQYMSCIQLELQVQELDIRNTEHATIVFFWANQLLRLSEQVSRMIKSMRPHGLVFFQGYLPDSAVLRRIGVQQEIPFLSIERSAFDKRLIWDNISGITVNRNTGRNLYWRHSDWVSNRTAGEFLDHYLEKCVLNKHKEHTSSKEVFRFPDLPIGRLRILLIGQVYTDSSILFGVRNEMDPLNVLMKIVGLCRQEGHLLLVKLHPKEDSGISPIGTPYAKLTWRRIQQRFAHQDVRCDSSSLYVDHENRYSTSQLIQDCDVVVTMNSQAGLEAALMGKTVIVFGDAFYRDMGFTIDARDCQDISYILLNLKHLTIGAEEIRLRAAKFFYIYFHYCSFEPSMESFLGTLRKRLL